MSKPDQVAFDGFPYIVTRLTGGYFHITLLPQAFGFDRLLLVTRKQFDANRLPTCLVLDNDKSIYCYPDGTERFSTQIPRAALLTTERLKPCENWPRSADLLDRAKRLEELNRDIPAGGALFGDVAKGGRRATEAELTRLAGWKDSGVPQGLIKCHFCCEWKGQCIEPNPLLPNLLVTVHCLCENDNLCAWCGEYLRERKLNGNYYKQVTREVIHVPGFAAIGHRCTGTDPAISQADPCEMRRQTREALIRRVKKKS